MQMDTVHVQSVIICTKARRGKGTEESVLRVITEVFDLSGSLIAESDPRGGYTEEQVRAAIKKANPQIKQKEAGEIIDNILAAP